MPDKPVLYTPDGVNQLLPRIRLLLPELRSMREEVIAAQNKCDVEELTSFGSSGKAADDARARIEEFRARIQSVEKDFEKKLRVFEEIGCELKGIDPGLVDFYSKRGGEVVYLCWREGESRIGFWHSLSGGFAARHPL